MYTLKGAIFSLRDTLVVEGSIDPTLMGETVKLLKFLLARNVTPVIVSNSSWIETASKREIPDILSEMVGHKIPYFRGGHDMPPYLAIARIKQSAVEPRAVRHAAQPPEPSRTTE